ncbi:MAG: hypothetical protein GY895_08195 [Phycisphaera sp.]|nr:hypothetical protein [Phycisphaera sp.]
MPEPAGPEFLVKQSGGRRLAMFVALAMSILTGGGNAWAQDANAYDAWSALLDRLSPNWNDPEANTAAEFFTQEEYDAIWEWQNGPLEAPSDAVESYFRKAESLIPLIEDLGGTPRFDAALDYDQGFMLLLPHLGEMRAVSRISSNLALRATANGDVDDAVKWLGTLNQISFHAGQDGVVISSLVGASMYLKSDQTMEMAIAQGLIDADAAGVMLKSLPSLDDVIDPFQFGDSIAGERILMEQSIHDLIGEDGVPPTMESLDVYRAAFGNQKIDEILDDAGDGNEIREMMDGLFDRVQTAFEDPDRERGLQMLAEIEAELDSPDIPAIIGNLFPDFAGLAEARIAAEDALADRIRGLEAVASGRIPPDAIRNAALLWDQLGAWFERLPAKAQLAGLEILETAPDDERLGRLLAAAAGRSSDLLKTVGDDSTVRLDPEAIAEARAEPMVTWITEVEPETDFLVTLAADAAAITKCDFPVGYGLGSPLRFRGRDLDRLRGAGRGLLIDATVRLRLARTIEMGTTAGAVLDGEPDTPSGRTLEDTERQRALVEIVSVIALIEDLVSDPAIAHVVLAADLMDSLQVLLASDEATAILDDPLQRDMISAGLAGIPRLPALGVRDAAKRDLQLWIDRDFGDSEEAAATIRRTLDNRGPDRIHALLTRCHGFILEPAPSANGDARTSIPPATLRVAPPSDTGSLKLIASSTGVHGAEWIVIDTTASRKDLLEVLEEIRSNPARSRRLLAGLERAGSFGLGARAAGADAVLAELDQLIRDRRRGSQPPSTIQKR